MEIEMMTRKEHEKLLDQKLAPIYNLLHQLSIAKAGSKKLLNTDEAANYLGISKRTMESYRVTGKGPRASKVSKRCVRYDIKDLKTFVERKKRKSTSDPGKVVKQG